MIHNGILTKKSCDFYRVSTVFLSRVKNPILVFLGHFWHLFDKTSIERMKKHKEERGEWNAGLQRRFCTTYVKALPIRLSSPTTISK